MKEKIILIWLLLITALVGIPALSSACLGHHMDGNRALQVAGINFCCQSMDKQMNLEMRSSLLKAAQWQQYEMAQLATVKVIEKIKVKDLISVRDHPADNCCHQSNGDEDSGCSDGSGCSNGSGCPGCYCTMPVVAPMILTKLPAFEPAVAHRNPIARISKPIHLPAGFGFIWRPPKIVSVL